MTSSSFVYSSPRISRITTPWFTVFLMNSNEFKLIFGLDTESEDYSFSGFAGEDLIMADTNASSKKHSMSKRSPTTPSVQENDVEATSQVEPCIRPCLNWPKSKQKSSEEDGPNGPCPGMGSDNQDACHVAHIGQDAGDAETNQLSRFRHLERMVKLIATHVGLSLGQDSDPICLDANDGFDPDWSPDPDDDDQDHVNITEVIPDPRPPQNRRKVDDALCSKGDVRVAEEDGIFFYPPDAKPDMFVVDGGIAEYVSSYFCSTISDDSFKVIIESTKNPNINFFKPPLLNSSVTNRLKSSENKSLINGDRFLSKTQSFLTGAATPIIGI